MKTAEKILWNNGVCMTDHISSSAYDATIKAMEEYAIKQAIKFAKWKDETFYTEYANPKYENDETLYSHKRIGGEFSLEEVYEHFKEEEK